MKVAGGGEKGKRKNLHVENTRPYGQDLKQQERARRHKGSSRDRGVAGLGVSALAFGVLPQFPQGGRRMKGRMLGCFFPAPFLPFNNPLGMPGWGRGGAERCVGGVVQCSGGPRGGRGSKGPGLSLHGPFTW